MGILSDTTVRAAKPGKYEDGDGLRLVVDKKGNKRWVFRFQVCGRRKEMGLGSYPLIKIADARRLASEARAKIVSGTDPIAARAARRLNDKRIPTFKEVADLVVAAEEAKGLPAKSLAQLKRYLGPGYVQQWFNRSVNSLTSVDVMQLLAPLRKEKPEACRKLYPALKKVFSNARIRLRDEHGIEFVNPANWDDLKAMGYAAPDRLTRGSHPSAHYEALPEIMAAIRTSKHKAARMLELVILTNVRTDAVRFAKADDIDWDNKVWIIPPAHLKDKKTRGLKPFRVPLTERAFEIARSFKPESGAGLLFTHDDGKAFSYAFMLNHLNALNGNPAKWTDMASGRAIVVHGFRGSFATWCEETQNFPTNVLREAMGRVVGNQVDRVYRHTDLLDQRRLLMDNWQRHCLPIEGNVVSFPKGKSL